MNFTEHYFVEAKLSVGRQFLNIFSKTKKINVDLSKDIKDKGYFGETNKTTFNEINNMLADSYRKHKELKKRKKLTQYDSDKILDRMSKKREMDIQAGEQIVNVFELNPKGDINEVIPDNNELEAGVVYETGRKLLHYGYIVLIITTDPTQTTNDDTLEPNRYFVGADSIGLKFFTELFGTNMDMYVAADAKTKRQEKAYRDRVRTVNKPKEAKSTMLVKKLQGNVEYKNQFLDNIHIVWGSSENGIVPSMRSKIKDIVEDTQNINWNGEVYTLENGTKVGVYVGGDKYASNIQVNVVYFNGENTIQELKRLRLFDNIDVKEIDLINGVKPLADIKKLS